MIKEELRKACCNYVEERMVRIRNSMRDLDQALAGESKSSAGDKYETGREMINLEFQKHQIQLEEFTRLHNTLARISAGSVMKKVALGAVVKTTAANYFIAIPAGKLNVDKEIFYAVGAKSPVAQALLGKSENDEFVVNDTNFRILEIV